MIICFYNWQQRLKGFSRNVIFANRPDFCLSVQQIERRMEWVYGHLHGVFLGYSEVFLAIMG